MQKYLVMVEGKADAPFLRDYFIFLIKDLSVLMDKSNQKELLNEDLFIKIIVAGGKNISAKHKTKMREHLDADHKIVLIQDADSPEKDPNDGGKELREKYFGKVKEELNIDFETFLFPNNESDGDLETLLLEIINQDKFDKSFDCYKKYADCSGAISIIGNKGLLEGKRVLFNYFRTYYGIDKAKEEERVFESIYWDFTSEHLDTFKDFINSILLKKKVG